MNFEKARDKAKAGYFIRRSIWTQDMYVRNVYTKTWNEWGEIEYRHMPIKHASPASQDVEIPYHPDEEDLSANDWVLIGVPASMETKVRAYDELKVLLEDTPLNAIEIPKYECFASCKDCARLHDCKKLRDLRSFLGKVQKSKLKRSVI